MKPEIIAQFSERPRIVEYLDGVLVAFHITKTYDQQVVIRYSRNEGKSWSEDTENISLPRDPGRWAGPQALVDREGRVHLFLMNDRNTGVFRVPGAAPGIESVGIDERRIDIWHCRSSRDSSIWEEPKRIWKGYTGSLNSVVQTTSGRIILPFAYRTSRSWANRGKNLNAYWYVGNSGSTVLYSDDDGATWTRSASDLEVQAPTLSTYGAIEPVVIELSTGKLWMLIRTQLGRFYESHSTDGEKWSAPRPTSIVSSDSPAGMVRIPDGRLVLFWNKCLRYPYAFGGRHVLHGAISADDGETWVGHREVVRDPKRDEPPPRSGDHGTAYPFPIALRSGKVILVTGQGEGRIGVVRVDPEWFTETRQHERFEDGLGEWSVFGCRGVALEEDPEPPEPSDTSVTSTSPQKPVGGKKVLNLSRDHLDWPAVAVWNFPMGSSGSLSLDLRIGSGFGTATIMLTDHYSVPFDPEDIYFASYLLEIGTKHTMNSGVAFDVDRWQRIELRWECADMTCAIKVDNQLAGSIRGRHLVEGVCYLRIRANGAVGSGPGLWVRNLSAKIYPPVSSVRVSDH